MNGYSQYNEVLKVDYNVPISVTPPLPDIVKKGDDLLDLIFTVDPLTGLPTGDISQYMSDKTSAEVRDFISTNLMREVGDDGGLVDLPSNVREQFRELPDELLCDLSRDRFESVEDYEERINMFLESERDKYIDERKKTESAKFFRRYFFKDKDES